MGPSTHRVGEDTSRVGAAVAHRRVMSELQDVGQHELRAALVAIEAAAEQLSTQRARLTAHQLDELTRALVHDVRRVRPLLEERLIVAVDHASSSCVPHRDVRLTTCESR